MFDMLLAAGTGTTTGTTTNSMGWMTWVWLVLMIVIFYFLLIRPQRKQQKEQEAMMAELKPGVSIMTTGGFYGVVLDIVEDTVIVEFGNNKNCRIPMNKAAIAQIDRPEASVSEEVAEESDKKDKKISVGKKKED